MYNQNRDIAAIFAGAAFSTALLLAEHVLLWPYREEISKPEAYVIGGATLGAGAIVASAIMGDWKPAATIWAGLIGGGLAVGGGYELRGLLEGSQKSAERAKRIQARIERTLNGYPNSRGLSRN